jgi:hypothetical protein
MLVKQLLLTGRLIQGLIVQVYLLNEFYLEFASENIEQQNPH